MSIHHWAVLFAAVAAHGVLVRAAPGAQLASDEAQFHAAADIVLVPASVTDEHGRFVDRLTREDFVLREDGVIRPIAQFTAERVPVSLGVVLDTSGSMAGERLGAAHFALQQLIGTLESNDELFLESFSDVPKVVVPWTRSVADILTAVADIQPHGNTALFRAVGDAYPMLAKGRNVRKALVVISDGNDNEGRLSVQTGRYGFTTVPSVSYDTQLTTQRLQTAVQRAQRSNTVVYAVGIGPKTGPDKIDVVKLQLLTDPTGGYTELVGSALDAPGAAARIGEDLRMQYLLGFQSGITPDGKSHTILLMTRDQRYRVRARSVFVAAR
jgi:VWFA-related protein